MSEVALTLFVDLREGSRIELEVAAKAALAWSRMIKSIGLEIDPFNEWKVELESSLPGSQKIRSIIRLRSTTESKAAIIGAVVASLSFVSAQAAGWSVGQVLTWLVTRDAPPEVVTLTDGDRHQIAEEVVRLLERQVGQIEVGQVVQALGEDPDVVGVGVTSSPDRRPEIVLPRALFPVTIDSPPIAEGATRSRVEEVDLILVRPVLTTQTNRKWGFESFYGKFSAAIRDIEFLTALAEGRLNAPLAQGIRMVVELEVTERLINGLWRPTERVVNRVLRIVPPAMQQSLGLEGPQED